MSASAADPREPLVSLRGITKRFGPLVANDAIDLDIHAGEIYALLGENGAGKSTLMNILFGLIQPDEGVISVDGAPVVIQGPRRASRLGIGMVHQHFKLVPTLTVAENLILGRRRGLVLSRRAVRTFENDLANVAKANGLDVDPQQLVGELSVGERQRVEILRALNHAARILILDEPTATLSPTEIEAMLPRLTKLAEGGLALIIITHHLDEVMAIADQVTVLRAGRVVAERLPGDTTMTELAELMVGHAVSLSGALVTLDPVSTGPPGRHEQISSPVPRLEASAVSADNGQGDSALIDVTFDVAPGEIVGFAGVEGNGQAELEEVLFGLRPTTSGTIAIAGHDVTGAPPRARLDLGMALVPSDRYRRGLASALSIADNLVADRVDHEPLSRRGWLRPAVMTTVAAELTAAYGIRTTALTALARTLSGGNAQRVVLARTLSREPSVLVAAQPTRGLDVGAIEYVHGQLRQQCQAGAAVVLISTDLNELLSLADRCYVLYRGQLQGPWPRGGISRHELGLAMGGVTIGPEPCDA